MIDDYEINVDTLAIIPIDEDTSRVYEEDTEYIVNRSSNSIIKDNCEYYGSSYKGRCEGTKYLTGIKTKQPIIVEESRNIIFFPTSSTRDKQSYWIALNKVNDYEKKKYNSTVKFKNNKSIDLNISYYSLDNQICRATMLKSKLYEIKMK